MFGFRSRKNVAKQEVTLNEGSLNNKNADQPANQGIYQAKTKFGVKPEYFDYDKIELNKFLTGDKEYRSHLRDSDIYCDQFKDRSCVQKNCCLEKRFRSDLQAFDDINTAIDTSIEANTFMAVSGARKNYFHDLDNHKKEVQQKAFEEKFYRDNPHHRFTDKHGLEPSDYENIAMNLNHQAQVLSQETKRMLLEERTKVLDLDSLKDIHINPYIVRNLDTKYVHDKKDKYYHELEEYKKMTKKVSPEFLMDRNYMRTLGSTRTIADGSHNIDSLNEYNFDNIKKTEKLLDLQGRLKEPPTIFEVMAEQEQKEKTIEAKDDVIDLDKLTPYNVVRPDVRIRKSEKRNIQLNY